MAAYFDLLAEAARAVDPLKVTRAAELLNHIISRTISLSSTATRFLTWI